MNDSEKISVSKMLIATSELYDKTLSKDAVRVYVNILSGYSEGQINDALNKHVRTSKWLPKPAELIELIDGRQEDHDKDAAIAAWAIAYNHITSGKARSGSEIGIPEIDATARLMGGWSRLSEMMTAEIPFREKEFCEKFGRTSKNDALGHDPKSVLDRVGMKPKMLEENRK